MMQPTLIQRLSHQLTWSTPARGVSPAFDHVMDQVASTRPDVSTAQLKVQQSKLFRQNTLFNMFSTGSSPSTNSLWGWAAQELTAPAPWTSEVARVMGGLDPQLLAITQQAAAIAKNPSGTTLPF